MRSDDVSQRETLCAAPTDFESCAVWCSYTYLVCAYARTAQTATRRTSQVQLVKTDLEVALRSWVVCSGEQMQFLDRSRIKKQERCTSIYNCSYSAYTSICPYSRSSDR